MSTNVTYQEFINIQGATPGSTVFGDIKEMVRLENLRNPEFLNPMFVRHEDTPDTFPFEYQIIPQVKALTKVSDSTSIQNPRVTIIFPDQWPDGTTTWNQVGYNEDVRTKRSAKEWGTMVATREQNNYVSRLVVDNFIVLEMVYNYALATGRFKILPNLDTPTATRDEIVQSVYGMMELCAALEINMTNVNIGLTKERLQIVTNPFTNISLLKAATFINASDKAFNVYVDGVLGKFGGYPYRTNPFIGQSFVKGTSVNNLKTFNFSNVLAFIYNIDNVHLYTKPWVELGIDGGIITNINDKTVIYIEKTWKSMGLIQPSREHLQYLIVKTAPTLVDINAARTWLSQFQPALYAGYATALTNDQYNAIITNANNTRYVSGSDVPQDGLPRSKKNVISASTAPSKQVVKDSISKGVEQAEHIDSIIENIEEAAIAEQEINDAPKRNIFTKNKK